MGAYLSSPICDKDTNEDSNNRLAFAASSMQGWRMSQEDAHNAILNFDDNTSLFAVYDGHGGAEIAIYCSRYLPDFIKNLPSYREGRLNDALIEGFIKFDSVLLDTNVKKVLQKLANDENEETDQPHEFVASLNPNEENHHNDELNIEEAQLLKKEAEVPIEELLKRYNGDEKTEISESENVVITHTTEENISNEEITTVYIIFCVLLMILIYLGS
jgi:protein phosphatase 1G